MTVFTNELRSTFAESARPAVEACLLPPVCYTSPEFFDFEMRTIWSRDWLALGRGSQIPDPGDFFTITMAGEPLIVVRDKDGAIRVLSAVCRHQGMILAGGGGNCTTFTCPYHLWTYGLDGRLLGAPAMERTLDFEKAENSLPQLAVETWNGFIFTSFDPHPAPLAPSLRGAEEVLRNYDLEHAFLVPDDAPVLPWNWKVMLENFVDGYHAHRLHHLIYDYGPGEGLEFIPWHDGDNHITRVNHQTVPDASFNPTLRAVLPTFAHLTDEERTHGVFVLFPPSLALAIQPDQIVYFIINPRGPAEIQIFIGWLLDPAAPAEPLFARLFEQIVKPGVMNFVIDDIRVDTMIQVGLSSRFGPRGRYSWQQESQSQFNRWLVARYEQFWPGDAMNVDATREPQVVS
jgi:phenylpropionate dioxygenase-like ring-hydroxylating dioxygenase large terminal subunit